MALVVLTPTANRKLTYVFHKIYIYITHIIYDMTLKAFFRGAYWGQFSKTCSKVKYMTWKLWPYLKRFMLVLKYHSQNSYLLRFHLFFCKFIISYEFWLLGQRQPYLVFETVIISNPFFWGRGNHSRWRLRFVSIGVFTVFSVAKYDLLVHSE